MDSQKITVELDGEDAEFLKKFAKENSVSASVLFVNYLHQLKKLSEYQVHPSLKKLIGIVPDHVDVKSEYNKHLETKHL